MGNKGTEAAKEAAEVVLADDNFATIANAVREGRAVYDNLKKFILFMLPTNGGEALIVIAAILFQLTLPMTPAQILWINMVTSSTLGLALAFDPAERGLMQRPPRPPAEPLLSLFFVWRVLLVSLLMMAGALGLFLWELEHGTGLESARTMAVNSVVVCEMFYLLNSRHIYDSVLSREGLFGNRQVLLAIAACVVLQLLYTYAPPLQALFGSVGLAPGEWARVLLAGLGLFCVAELESGYVAGSVPGRPDAARSPLGRGAVPCACAAHRRLRLGSPGRERSHAWRWADSEPGDQVTGYSVRIKCDQITFKRLLTPGRVSY